MKVSSFLDLQFTGPNHILYLEQARWCRLPHRGLLKSQFLHSEHRHDREIILIGFSRLCPAYAACFHFHRLSFMFFLLSIRMRIDDTDFPASSIHLHHVVDLYLDKLPRLCSYVNPSRQSRFSHPIFRATSNCDYAKLHSRTTQLLTFWEASLESQYTYFCPSYLGCYFLSYLALALLGGELTS